MYCPLSSLIYTAPTLSWYMLLPTPWYIPSLMPSCYILLPLPLDINWSHSSLIYIAAPHSLLIYTTLHSSLIYTVSTPSWYILLLTPFVIALYSRIYVCLPLYLIVPSSFSYCFILTYISLLTPVCYCSIFPSYCLVFTYISLLTPVCYFLILPLLLLLFPIY